MNYKMFVDNALTPGLKLLPGWMDTVEARVQLLATFLQESSLMYRHQVGGPARGYPQFETGSISAVLTNSITGPTARFVMDKLDYTSPTVSGIHEAVMHNDILAVVFARLLLSADPESLAKRGDGQKAWQQYLRTWRPGKPHPDKWPACWSKAWTIVDNSGVPA